jgi:hypothetical protein
VRPGRIGRPTRDDRVMAAQCQPEEPGGGREHGSVRGAPVQENVQCGMKPLGRDRGRLAAIRLLDKCFPQHGGPPACTNVATTRAATRPPPSRFPGGPPIRGRLGRRAGPQWPRWRGSCPVGTIVPSPQPDHPPAPFLRHRRIPTEDGRSGRGAGRAVRAPPRRLSLGRSPPAVADHGENLERP